MSKDLRHFHDLFHKFQDATMVREDAYVANLSLVQAALERVKDKDSCLIECGTWRGGMAAGLIGVGGPLREYHFFDSFMGLPPTGENDGEDAWRWQHSPAGERFFNNCCASRREFEDTLAVVDDHLANTHIHEGWFSETFPNVSIRSIAVLRIDADWYDSVLSCLEKFWDNVVSGGVVIIDDYYDWEGCRKALHTFLGYRKVPEALRITREAEVCHIIKL